jgi:hypothetical protein
MINRILSFDNLVLLVISMRNFLMIESRKTTQLIIGGHETRESLLLFTLLYFWYELLIIFCLIGQVLKIRRFLWCEIVVNTFIILYFTFYDRVFPEELHLYKLNLTFSIIFLIINSIRHYTNRFFQIFLNIIYHKVILRSSYLNNYTIASLNDVKYQDNCVICFEKFREVDVLVKFKCLHIFHKTCIEEYNNISRNFYCPLCRE